MKRHGLLPAILLLAACANKAPKTPVAPGDKLMADRLDALEADMATMQAEMQELRVQYLPIDEMSEDEFERHVQKRVEGLPADKKEAVEKELRGRRKASNLKGKGLATYWDERFAAEPTDDPWSKGATLSCRPKLEKTIPQGGKLGSFECRKERCRADLDFPGEGTAIDEAMKACDDDTETFAGSTATSRVTKSNGRVHAVVFIVRKGYSMKVE